MFFEMNNAIPLPPIAQQPDLMNQIYFLKREWEHSMQVNTILGRDAEQLQQLMHAQFQFLEHVVLDMTRQMRHLQEQLLVQQNSNQKMQEQVTRMERLLHDAQKNQLEKQKSNEYQQIVLDSNVKELIQQLPKIDVKIGQHDQQIQTILLSFNGQETKISKFFENQTALQNELKELRGLSHQSVNQSDLLVVEQKNMEQERLSFKHSISQLESQTINQIELLDTKYRERHDSLKQSLDHSKKERLQEHRTLIEVLNTLKTSISSIRQEQKQFESKSLLNLTNILTQYKEQISREMKIATKAIFIQ
jgi:hypothetical protein